MYENYLIGRLEWFSCREGGRVKPPHAGQFAPTVIDSRDPGGTEGRRHRSVAMDLDSAVETGDGTLVEFRFFAPELTAELARPGASFAIMDGQHQIGWLTVVRRIETSG